MDLTTLVPSSLQEAAGVLQASAEAGRTVRIEGAGSKRRWRFLGGAEPADSILSTAGLTRIVAHVPDDLTITVEAGTPLRDLQAALATQGQWLPIDPPMGDRATVGGTLATGVAGLRRHRYGHPRDRVLAMRVAYPTGEVASSGARVVKNVAGFDVHRLHAGAFGTLGLIGEVTFKVAPRPEARQALAIPSEDLTAAAALAAQIAGGPTMPAFLAITNHLPSVGPGRWMVLGYEDLELCVQRAIRDTRSRNPQAAGAQQFTDASLHALERDCWSDLHEAPLVLRLWTRPTRLARLAQILAGANNGWCIDALTGQTVVSIDPGRGILAPAPSPSEGRAGVPEPIPAHADGPAAVSVTGDLAAPVSLGASSQPDGATAPARAGATALGALLPRLGEVAEAVRIVTAPPDRPFPREAPLPAGTLSLMRAVRAALDPGRTLNPGLGPDR